MISFTKIIAHFDLHVSRKRQIPHQINKFIIIQIP